MVTKSLKIALCIALSGISAFASESATLAARAQKSLKAGKFAKGYSQLERALVASRKEADVRSEGRIFIAMGQVRTMSLDFELADSLLNYVQAEGLDRSTKIMLVKAKTALKNASIIFRFSNGNLKNTAIIHSSLFIFHFTGPSPPSCRWRRR